MQDFLLGKMNSFGSYLSVQVVERTPTGSLSLLHRLQTMELRCYVWTYYKKYNRILCTECLAPPSLFVYEYVVCCLQQQSNSIISRFLSVFIAGNVNARTRYVKGEFADSRVQYPSGYRRVSDQSEQYLMHFA